MKHALVPSRAFKNCTSLTNLVMVCPNLNTYQTECLLNISPTNDVTEIISANTQGNGWGQYKELQVAASAMIYGSLSLTNVANAHHLLSFSSMNCVTNFSFTGPFTGAMGSGDGMVGGHGKVMKLTYWFENVTYAPDGGGRRMAGGSTATFGIIRGMKPSSANIAESAHLS